MDGWKEIRRVRLLFSSDSVRNFLWEIVKIFANYSSRMITRVVKRGIELKSEMYKSVFELSFDDDRKIVSVLRAKK